MLRCGTMKWRDERDLAEHPVQWGTGVCFVAENGLCSFLAEAVKNISVRI